jgi:NADH:ubiquinone oxidoreductase subunit H
MSALLAEASIGFFLFTSLLKILGIVFLIILPMVSYSVYAERRVSALIQDRLGPNRVGPAGLFQPVADAMKQAAKVRVEGRVGEDGSLKIDFTMHGE